MVRIGANEFAVTVNEILLNYGDATTGAMARAIDEVSKEALSKIRKASRAEFGKKGDYAKGWRRDVQNERTHSNATIYGVKPTYQLAHLLEKGHVSRNGTGRTFGTVSGHAHIAPVAEWADETVTKRMIEYVEGIT